MDGDSSTMEWTPDKKPDRGGNPPAVLSVTHNPEDETATDPRSTSILQRTASQPTPDQQHDTDDNPPVGQSITHTLEDKDAMDLCRTMVPSRTDAQPTTSLHPTALAQPAATAPTSRPVRYLTTQPLRPNRPPIMGLRVATAPRYIPAAKGPSAGVGLTAWMAKNLPSQPQPERRTSFLVPPPAGHTHASFGALMKRAGQPYQPPRLTKIMDQSAPCDHWSPEPKSRSGPVDPLPASDAPCSQTAGTPKTTSDVSTNQSFDSPARTAPDAYPITPSKDFQSSARTVPGAYPITPSSSHHNASSAATTGNRRIARSRRSVDAVPRIDEHTPRLPGPHPVGSAQHYMSNEMADDFCITSTSPSLKAGRKRKFDHVSGELSVEGEDHLMSGVLPALDVPRPSGIPRGEPTANLFIASSAQTARDLFGDAYRNTVAFRGAGSQLLAALVAITQRISVRVSVVKRRCVGQPVPRAPQRTDKEIWAAKVRRDKQASRTRHAAETKELIASVSPSPSPSHSPSPPPPPPSPPRRKPSPKAALTPDAVSMRVHLARVAKRKTDDKAKKMVEKHLAEKHRAAYEKYIAQEGKEHLIGKKVLFAHPFKLKDLVPSKPPTPFFKTEAISMPDGLFDPQIYAEEDAGGSVDQLGLPQTWEPLSPRFQVRRQKAKEAREARERGLADMVIERKRVLREAKDAKKRRKEAEEMAVLMAALEKERLAQEAQEAEERAALEKERLAREAKEAEEKAVLEKERLAQEAIRLAQEEKERRAREEEELRAQEAAKIAQEAEEEKERRLAEASLIAQRAEEERLAGETAARDAEAAAAAAAVEAAEEVARKGRNAANLIREVDPEVREWLENFLHLDLEYQVLVKGPSGGPVLVKNLDRTLERASWMDDEMVDHYVAACTQRANEKRGYTKASKAKGQTPPFWSFASAFSQILVNLGPDGLKGYNKRPNFADGGFLDCELLLIPICDNAHWRLMTISGTNREIRYYDSLARRPSAGNRYTRRAIEWLKFTLEEHYNEDEWQVVIESLGPQQQNGSDCGVFVCLNAACVVQGIDINATTYDGSEERMHVARYQIADTVMQAPKSFTGPYDWE